MPSARCGSRRSVTDWANTVLIPALVSGAVYALIATGFNVGARTTGVLNFAHGNLVTLAPLGVLVFTRTLGLPVVLSFICAFLAVLALTLIEEWLAIRPFMQSGGSLPWILSTLGAGIILGELGSLPFHGETLGFPYHFSFHPWSLGGVRIAPVQVATVVVAVVAVVLLQAFYRLTLLGRQLEAVAEDLDGARAIGIYGSRMSQLAFALSAVLAIVTGWAVAPTLGVSAGSGLALTFTGFVATAIGGIGSISGGLIGGVVVGVLSQVAIVYVGSTWTNALVFGGLIAVYVVRPAGLFGKQLVRAV